MKKELIKRFKRREKLNLNVSWFFCITFLIVTIMLTYLLIVKGIEHYEFLMTFSLWLFLATLTIICDLQSRSYEEYINILTPLSDNCGFSKDRNP